MIKLGTGNTTLYLGDKKVKAVWLGTEKVYPNSFLELSASSLSFAAAGASLPLVITVNDGQAWAIAALPAGFSASVTSGTGPTSVTITAANNTSETTRTGSLTVISEELTASCSLLQTAGTKVYGAWQNVRLETEGNITSFAASGGTAKIHMVVERTWTWNGVAGSGGTETNWSQPANVTVSDAIASVSADVLTIGSLGTTFKAATQILIEAGTASDTISTHRKTLAITQAANAVTNTTQSGGTYTYGNVSAGTITNATIPASGGSATATAGNGSQSWNRTAIIATDTYTSGSTAQRTIQAATSGTNTVAPSRTTLSGTASSKGQVQSDRTTVSSATVTWTANGTSASGTMYVYQQENKLIQMSSDCSGYTRYGVREYTSGSYEYSEQNSYYCGYRETVPLTVSVMQNGILRAPVFNNLQAWSCRTANVQGQGSSTVTFSNPRFGVNLATLSLSESERDYGYVLFQLSMTYTDSGGPGVSPNYVWSGAVTYSGSLAIYTKANAGNANVTVSAATRSTASLQEDAETLLRQAESAGIELPDEIKAELTAIAGGKE